MNMNMDLKQLAAPLEAHYEKFLAFGLIVCLLGSALILVVGAAQARVEFAQHTKAMEALKPLHPKVAKLSLEPFERAHDELSKPKQIITSRWTNDCFIPEHRVLCQFCTKPIPYEAKKCVFCKEEVVITDTNKVLVVDIGSDRDKDGMTDVWEEKYGLDPDNPADADKDLDEDGWTNKQEYDDLTEPNLPTSVPSVYKYGNLVVLSANAVKFDLMFKNYMESGQDKYIFQINNAKTGETKFQKIGSNVRLEGFTNFVIESFEKKWSANESTGGSNDVSELTLKSPESTVVLVMDRLTEQVETTAKLFYIPKRETYDITGTSEFEIQGQKFKVIRIDVEEITVLLFELSTQREVLIETEKSGFEGE